MTRDELLQKGVSEDVADEIIAAFEEAESPHNSLELLEKALNKDSDKEESLFKAEDKDEDDEDEDDYDEQYMKKYMRRYMQANKKSCGKMAKELGIYGEEMKKAIEDIDTDAEGAVVEMTDLKPFLDSQSEFNEQMTKAIQELSSQIIAITNQTESGFDLLEKAARVQVEQAKAIDGFFSVPQGRKGAVSQGVAMRKAAELPVSPEARQHVYSVLMKATKGGDRKAGEIISTFESAGQNINLLSQEQRHYVNELITKEAH